MYHSVPPLQRACAPMPVVNNNNNNGVVASTCARGATPPLGADSSLGTATPPHCPAPHKCIYPAGTGLMGYSSDDDYDINTDKVTSKKPCKHGHTPIEYRDALINIWPHACHKAWTINNNSNNYVNIYHAVRRNGLQNFIQARVPVPSALDIPAWKKLLKS